MGHEGSKSKRRKKKRREHEPAQGGAASQAAADDVELDLTDVASLIPEPPSEPAPRMRSGFAPRLPERDLSDRAEIDVEDLSLRPDNPYVASPLLSVPLEEPTVSPAARAAKLVGIGLLVASSTYGVWAAVRDLRSSTHAQVARAEISDARAPLRTSDGATLQPSERAAERSASTHVAGVASGSEAAPRGEEPARGPALPAEPAVQELTPPSAPSTTDRAAHPNAAQLTRAASSAAALAPTLPVLTPALPTPKTTGAASAPDALTRASVPAPAPSPQTAPGPLPKRPSRDALRASFVAIKPLLHACVPGRHGLVTIHARIHGHGRISQGSIEGLDQTTEEERMCMTHALLELRFPPFQQDAFSAAFPLAL